MWKNILLSRGTPSIACHAVRADVFSDVLGFTRCINNDDCYLDNQELAGEVLLDRYSVKWRGNQIEAWFKNHAESIADLVYWITEGLRFDVIEFSPTWSSQHDPFIVPKECNGTNITNGSYHMAKFGGQAVRKKHRLHRAHVRWQKQQEVHEKQEKVLYMPMPGAEKSYDLH